MFSDSAGAGQTVPGQQMRAGCLPGDDRRRAGRRFLPWSKGEGDCPCTELRQPARKIRLIKSCNNEDVGMDRSKKAGDLSHNG